MKKKKYIIAVVVIVLVGGYYWYSKSHPAIKSVQYKTTLAEKGALTASVSASGNIIVDTQSTVNPTIDGTVSDLSVKVGDSVEKGQFLFNIINDDLNVSVAQAAASYQQALNSLQSAQVDKKDADASYEAAKDKDEKDGSAYTVKQLNVLKEKVRLAKEKIIYAEKSLAASGTSYQNEKENAAKRKVVAPISGTIQEINIKNGDDLGNNSSSSSSNESPMIIGDPETLKAEVSVNEVDIADVSIGQKAMISLDALGDVEFAGKVEKIDSLGTSESGVVSYDVIISFDDLDGKIKPGMTVSASIITEMRSDVIIVPSSAVKSDGDGSYVEILANGNPQKKTVTVGIENDTNMEITGGLSAGEKVVTETIDSSSSASSAKSSSSSSSSNRSGGIGIPGMGGGPR